MSARVSFHQRGYAGRKATLTVRDGDKVLASREITFGADGNDPDRNAAVQRGRRGRQVAAVLDRSAARRGRIAPTTPSRAWSTSNPDKRRILYVEGEPRWEYKFIRRAEDDDRIVQVASMLRTTENKIYRQGIDDPKELADGFPTSAEDLFAYQGLIIGSVEASYFTPAQQDLIRQFVDRRGGGLLLLGGRFALADGGWAGSNLADLLPVVLPNGKNTFHRDPATVELTPAGADSIITRLVDDPGEERRALEEAALPDGLSGAGHAQAGRGGAGGDERRRAQDAAADHGKLRPRAHRRAGHRRARGAGR